MITGPRATELANAVRTVAAAHLAAGAPEVSELDRAWQQLVDALDHVELQDTTGAIEDYVRQSLDAIREVST